MRNVVIDTNCLVQMISLHSPYRPVWQAFREGKFYLCVSDEILYEYLEVLERLTNAFVLKRISFPKLNLVTLDEFLLELQHL